MFAKQNKKTFVLLLPDKKPHITYPCFWSYTIIGADHVLIPQNVAIILENYDYHLKKSHHSQTGKYISFNLSVFVKNENERNHIFVMLGKIPTVKIVI
jgi:putative lipoic acid-binding regulatory protein